MDLPESPESLNAFSSLAASETGDASGDAIGGVKSKKGKDKRKRRRRKEKESAPKRPSDPLPACRRARLVDYLQPISTMLDACTVTKPPPVNDDGGGASADGDKAKGSQSRAYDGTLADFMGLALVEHFAERLPRTLGALFEDFERHPPPALTAALTGTPSSAGRLATGGAVAAGNEAGGGASKDETDTVLGGANHALVAEEPFATGRYLIWFIFVTRLFRVALERSIVWMSTLAFPRCLPYTSISFCDKSRRRCISVADFFLPCARAAVMKMILCRRRLLASQSFSFRSHSHSDSS